MIDGVELKPLRIFPDDRGFFMETLRQDDPFFRGFGQSAVTVSYPGVIKAFHWHENQDDYWVVVRGMAQVVLHDLREDSPTRGETQVFYLGEQNMQCLMIPRGVAHGYRVLGTDPEGRQSLNRTATGTILACIEMMSIGSERCCS